MKKILFATTLIILLGTMSVSAQSGTYSSELTETTYAWEVASVSSDATWENGDNFEYEFSEAPGGLTYQEYMNLGISIEVNGDELDLNAEFSTYSDLEFIASLWILFWALPNPDTEFTTENGYTISGSEATDELGYTHSTTSGIVLKYDDGQGNVIEYQENGSSALPLNPAFALLGLFAIPVISRLRR